MNGQQAAPRRPRAILLGSASPWASVTRLAARALSRTIRGAPVAIRLWDGHEILPSAPPVATVVFRRLAALARVLADPEVQFGEAYMAGDVEVEGDLAALLVALFAARRSARRLPSAFTRRNGRHSSRANVHHHYDIGNDFYRLWLDRELVYTCAYFPTAGASLEEAQRAKLDLVCGKLRLRPGERVIEAGCGWGALAVHMAKTYGVKVDAYNVSREQVEYARLRVREEGLGHLVNVIEADYRNISGRCDAFVSVGMLEHVGLRDYRTLGAVVRRVLKPDGRGLLHFIGRSQSAPLNGWIRKRIFPGAYPPTLVEVFDRVLEPNDFAALDVENLRLHYAETLAHWLARYEAAGPQVAAMFDPPFVRAWRLYLAGSQAAFRTGSMQLFQVLFAPTASNAIAWTRRDPWPADTVATCRPATR